MYFRTLSALIAVLIVADIENNTSNVKFNVVY